MQNQKLYEKLSKYSSIIAEQPIHVTSQEVLPEDIQQFTKNIALTDGKRIYLPKKEEQDEEVLEIEYKRQCLEKIIEIKQGILSLPEDERPNFNEYEIPEIASTIFQVLESKHYEQTARQQFPSLYQGVENNEFLKNFINISWKLSKKEGKKLRKLASRFVRLTKKSQGDIKISNQYTNKIYNLLKNSLHKEESNNGLQELPDFLNFLDVFNNLFNLNYFGVKGEILQNNLNEIGRARDFVIQDFQEKKENITQKQLEQNLDNSLLRHSFRGAGDIRRLEDEIINEINQTTDQLYDHPLTSLYLKRLKTVEETINDDYTSFLSRCACEISHLKILFEKLKGEQYRKLKRQNSGNEVDIDAAIDFKVSIRNGEQPNENVYQDIHRKQRDVCAGILVDMSGSMEGEKIRSVKECGGILTEALEHIGDTYFIYGFEGDNLHLIKGTKDRSDSRKRLWGIFSEGGTPQSEATQDLISVFDTVDAKTKILITITDGSPNNLSSTRNALLSAKQRGIHPYSITLDSHGEEYLNELYGKTPYCICEDPSQLPEKAAKFYREVAF